MAVIESLRKSPAERGIEDVKEAFFSGIDQAVQPRRLLGLDSLSDKGPITARDFYNAMTVAPRDIRPDKGLKQAQMAIAESGGRIPVEITLLNGEMQPAHILSVSGKLITADPRDRFAVGTAEITGSKGKPREADVHISPSGTVFFSGQRPVRR